MGETIGIFIMLIPTVLAIGFFFYKGNYTRKNLIEVEATVVRVNKKSSSGRNGRRIMVYQPEFEYEWKKWKRTVRPEIWSSRASFQEGEKVILLVNPEKPGEFRYKSLYKDPILPILVFGSMTLILILYRSIIK